MAISIFGKAMILNASWLSTNGLLRKLGQYGERQVNYFVTCFGQIHNLFFEEIERHEFSYITQDFFT
jgi:hypothetical protein